MNYMYQFKYQIFVYTVQDESNFRVCTALASIPGRKEKGGLAYFVCACAK